MLRQLSRLKQMNTTKQIIIRNDGHACTLTSSYGSAAAVISFKETPKSSLREEKNPRAARTDTSATRRLKSLVGYSGPVEGGETSALLLSVPAAGSIEDFSYIAHI